MLFIQWQAEAISQSPSLNGNRTKEEEPDVMFVRRAAIAAQAQHGATTTTTTATLEAVVVAAGQTRPYIGVPAGDKLTRRSPPCKN